MRCPKCRSTELKELTVKNSRVRIDHCLTCKGVWFDGKELEKVLTVAAKELEIPSNAHRSPTVSCPRCEKPLYEFDYPQTLVKVDMCKKCHGLWLDPRELNEIKTVRQALDKRGKLDEYAMPPGIKGELIRFIDRALETLISL